MRLSSENSLKNIIYNNFGNERGSIYVHHTSQPNSISELESYFPFKKMKIFRRSELFTREYFSSQISLGNNVKFISEINNLDISEFLESHYLFDIFTKYKNFTRKDIPIDLRLICATHQNIEADIEAGKFRADLFYRINVFPIKLPTLA